MARMNKRSLVFAAAVALAVGPLTAAAADRLTLEEARTIALREVTGTVLEEELDREDGVAVYSFEIRTDKGATWEIDIDAATGKVVELENEDDDDDDRDDD